MSPSDVNSVSSISSPSVGVIAPSSSLPSLRVVSSNSKALSLDPSAVELSQSTDVSTDLIAPEALRKTHENHTQYKSDGFLVSSHKDYDTGDYRVAGDIQEGKVKNKGDKPIPPVPSHGIFGSVKSIHCRRDSYKSNVHCQQNKEKQEERVPQQHKQLHEHQNQMDHAQNENQLQPKQKRHHFLFGIELNDSKFSNALDIPSPPTSIRRMRRRRFASLSTASTPVTLSSSSSPPLSPQPRPLQDLTLDPLYPNKQNEKKKLFKHEGLQHTRKRRQPTLMDEAFESRVSNDAKNPDSRKIAHNSASSSAIDYVQNSSIIVGHYADSAATRNNQSETMTKIVMERNKKKKRHSSFHATNSTTLVALKSLGDKTVIPPAAPSSCSSTSMTIASPPLPPPTSLSVAEQPLREQRPSNSLVKDDGHINTSNNNNDSRKVTANNPPRQFPKLPASDAEQIAPVLSDVRKLIHAYTRNLQSTAIDCSSNAVTIQMNLREKIQNLTGYVLTPPVTQEEILKSKEIVERKTDCEIASITDSTRMELWHRLGPALKQSEKFKLETAAAVEEVTRTRIEKYHQHSGDNGSGVSGGGGGSIYRYFHLKNHRDFSGGSSNENSINATFDNKAQHHDFHSHPMDPSVYKARYLAMLDEVSIIRTQSWTNYFERLRILSRKEEEQKSKTRQLVKVVLQQTLEVQENEQEKHHFLQQKIPPITEDLETNQLIDNTGNGQDDGTATTASTSVAAASANSTSIPNTFVTEEGFLVAERLIGDKVDRTSCNNFPSEEEDIGCRHDHNDSAYNDKKDLPPLPSLLSNMNYDCYQSNGAPIGILKDESNVSRLAKEDDGQNGVVKELPYHVTDEPDLFSFFHINQDDDSLTALMRFPKSVKAQAYMSTEKLPTMNTDECRADGPHLEAFSIAVPKAINVTSMSEILAADVVSDDSEPGGGTQEEETGTLPLPLPDRDDPSSDPAIAKAEQRLWADLDEALSRYSNSVLSIQKQNRKRRKLKQQQQQSKIKRNKTTFL